MAQFNPLSKREWEVANLVLEGKSNKAIAAALHISESTVEFHIKNIYAKHQVSSRVELVLKLRESTVAGEGELSENRTMLNLHGWAISFKEAASNTLREWIVNSELNANARSAETPMTFFEAIRVCFTKYADFNGRATRAEFWWFALFITLIASVLTYISETLVSIFLIAVLLPLLAVGTRRLRDSGKSGWWQLFLLVPVGGIVLLGFLWAEPSIGPLPEDTQPV
jgi:DNA-binding CsgD family transcriptional regulator